jgi:hypothetical protein
MQRRYTLARKPTPTEENEETVLGDTLVTIITEPDVGSPDIEMMVSLELPFYRRSSVWGQTLLTTWASAGLTTLDEFRDWLMTNYGPEYILTLQGTNESDVGSP